MTAGTAVTFVFTGAVLLVAIAGGMWLESRMPAVQEQRGRPVSPPLYPGTPPAQPLPGPAVVWAGLPREADPEFPAGAGQPHRRGKEGRDEHA